MHLAPKTFLAALLLATSACSSSTPPTPPPQSGPVPIEPTPTPSASPSAAPVAKTPGPLTIDAFTAPDEAGAVNSYLLQDDRELVVVDGQLVVPAAEGLVAKIKATGKTPKAFVLTHAHPDHYFGFHALQQAFPGVPLYATAGVKADFDRTAAGTLQAMKGMLGPAAPSGLATVTVLEGALELGGEKLELVELKGGEHGVSAIVRVPSLKAVIAGDHLYLRVHNWMKECDAASWLAHLEDWKKGDPATVYYPGHGAGKGGVELLDANIAYLRGFQAEVASAKGADKAARVADAKTRVLAKFPDHAGKQFLDWTMADYLECSAPKPASDAKKPASDAKKPASDAKKPASDAKKPAVKP